MKTIIALSMTMALALSFTANAQSRTFADVYAECGIGALLFNKDLSGGDNGRILAIISNATWDWGTTAHISNQSSPENCQGASTTAAAFIYQNYDRIETDLAQGHGEYIDALVTNLSCNTADVKTAMRSKLGALVGGSEADIAFAKSSALYDSLVGSCNV